VFVVEVAAYATTRRRWGWRIARGGFGASRKVNGVISLAAGHAEVENFHDGVASSTSDEAFSAEGQNGVNCGEVVNGVLVGGRTRGRGAHIVKSGLCA